MLQKQERMVNWFIFIQMCKFVHTRGTVNTWNGFAELAKCSVLPMYYRDRLSDRNIKIINT